MRSCAVLQTATLVDFLENWAQSQPERVLYRFLPDGEGSPEIRTYAAMTERARAIASHLQHCRGERALLLFHSGLEFLEAFLGCLYAGVTAVPAYPPRKNHNMARLQAIIEDCQPRLVLTTEKAMRLAEPLFRDAFGALGNAALTDLQWLATESVASVDAGAYDNIRPGPEDLAFLQYTSGSTGNPKGVMVSHRNLVVNEHMIHVALGSDRDMHLVGWIPLFHDMGLIGIALHPIYLGGDALLMPPAAFLQKPYRWLKAISDIGTLGGSVGTAAPNFAYQLCIDQISDEQRATLDLSALRVALSGAEPVRASTLDAFTQRFAPAGFRRDAFCPSYGLAEATLMVTGASQREPIVRAFDTAALERHQVIAAADGAQQLVSSGRNQHGQDITLVDPHSLQQVGSNTVGEIWVRGAHIPRGYWNRPDATAATFKAFTANGDGPYMRTGDLGAYVDDELYITGRLKDLIIVRGRNLYPSDIEHCVEHAHPALRTDNSAAFAIDVSGEEQLVVMVEVERAQRMSLDTDAVIAAIRSAITTELEVPPHAVVLLKPGSILKTSSGKIQRSACRTAFLDGSLSVLASWQTQGHDLHATNDQEPEAGDFITFTNKQLQTWMLQWIAHRLKTNASALDTNAAFATLGLDSVDAIQLMGTLEGGLMCSIDQNLIWEYDSVAKLAPALLQLTSNTQDKAVSNDIEGSI